MAGMVLPGNPRLAGRATPSHPPSISWYTPQVQMEGCPSPKTMCEFFWHTTKLFEMTDIPSLFYPMELSLINIFDGPL